MSQFDKDTDQAQVAARSICAHLFGDSLDEDSESYEDYEEIVGYCQDYYLGDADVEEVVEALVSIYNLNSEDTDYVLDVLGDADQVDY